MKKFFLVLVIGLFVSGAWSEGTKTGADWITWSPEAKAAAVQEFAAGINIGREAVTSQKDSPAHLVIFLNHLTSDSKKSELIQASMDDYFSAPDKQNISIDYAFTMVLMEMP
ncbi:MAG: hypothetical protein ABSF43_17010 [Rectinemataceae bacterium]